MQRLLVDCSGSSRIMVDGFGEVKVSEMDAQPLVSICCITYNHAPFIRRCLEGFLIQKTHFPVEILIHDDASTDGTDEIIREFVHRYPDLIHPLFESENQYSIGNQNVIDFYNYSRARGKYIAYCEGDDYWTDPNKLQKQVDFMELHPDYSVSFHRCHYYDDQEGTFCDDFCDSLLCGQAEGIEISLNDYFHRWITQPLTMVFRMADFSFEWQSRYRYYRDYHEIYHLLKNGRGFLFSFFGGVHIKHPGGITSNDEKHNRSVSLAIAKELFLNNRDIPTKKNYESLLQWNISSNLFSNKERLKMSMKLFLLSKRLKPFVKNVVHLL